MKRRFLHLLLAAGIAGCSLLEDAATSLAADVEDGAGRLGAAEGSTRIVTHDAKSRASREARTITVQFDKVGALIVWTKDGNGKVLESGSTSHHARFVDTPETIIVDRPIDSALKVELVRRGGRAVVARVF